MITLPPRHGKSMLASQYFPAWYLGRNPSHYVISATYAQDLADDFGRQVRDQIADPQFSAIFDGVTLDTSSTSAKRFHIEEPLARVTTGQRGAYFAVGAGGPLTGRGAHLLIIDDPVKNMEEADSEIIRAKIKSWYSSTAYTRLMPGGRVLIIQTRWNEDDLSGWLLREHADEGWHRIDLPALAGPNDPLGRQPGEPLWPSQYGREQLQRTMAQLTPREWSALFQQDPSPQEGHMFKRAWFIGVDGARCPDPRTMSVYGASDLAVTSKDGDFTVHVLVGVDPNGDLWLLQVWRAQAGPAEWVKALCDMVEDCKANEIALVGWAFEKGQIESAARPLIETSLAARGLTLLREMFPTRGDKAIRATSIRGRLGQTGIRYRNGLMQVDELIKEMLAFPAAPHDDTVDAMGLIGQLLDKLRAGRPAGALSVPGGTHAADGTPLPPDDAPEPEEGYVRLPMPGDWDRDRYRIRL